MSRDDAVRLVNALKDQALQRGIQELDPEAVDIESDRSAIIEWLADADDEALDVIRTEAKRYTLGSHETRLDRIDEIAGGGLDVAVQALDIRTASYYDSFFGYTDHTTRIYKTQLGGIFGEIATEATSADAAQERFVEYCRDEDYEAYEVAAESIPAPLIGDLGDAAKPHVVQFEDADHLYVEYWNRGNVKEGFDIDTGAHRSIQTVYRPYLRVHLDSGLIEAAGDHADREHEDLIGELLSLFNSHQWAAPVKIGDAGMETTANDLAIQISLDEFEGEDAKVQFVRSDGQSTVEADDIHADAEAARDRVRTNFQLLLGETDDGWEVIQRSDIAARFADAEAATVAEIVSEFEDDATYHRVIHPTVTLHRDDHTIRIHGKNIAPSTRRGIVHLFADELGWR